MKKQKGITLIALVISIIVMLVLAGVSINAIVGENGVLTKAQNAKLASEEAVRREELEMILFEYNSSKFLGSDDGFTDYLAEIKANGTIQDYLYTDSLVIKYDDNYYEMENDGEYYIVKNRLESNLDSGANSSDNFIVTPDNLTSGSLDITAGSSYVILDKVSGEDFNFVIPAGEPVTIKLMGDMVIDNKGYKRSAIDLADGATLNLYVYGNVEVNSGYGVDGEVGNSNGAKGGEGAYAGIHVPEGATLNLYGNGEIVAYGGNAGKGTDSAERYGGGGGGNHSEGAGGYSGAGAQGNGEPGYNGKGGGSLAYINNGDTGSGGGGYFTKGIGASNINKGTGAIGGQTGCPWAGHDTDKWYSNRAGSGGSAGSGGNISYYSLENIYAYNGDMITNGDYETVYYEYNKDGTITSNILNPITKKNGDTFIPCKIFAQSGIIRETYTTNQGAFSLAKVNRTLEDDEILPAVATTYNEVVLVKATNENANVTTGYNNGYMLNQGIGSGAGYLEASNGTLTQVSVTN